MIITTRIALLIAAVLLVAVILQVSFFSTLPLLGASPNLVPVVVICLGLLGGAVVGGVAGFAAGLLLDAALFQTLGVSSLALLVAGYLAGRYRESFEITNPLTPIALVGGLTFVAQATFAAIELTLGVQAPVSLLIVREIFVQAFLAALLAIPIYPALRRVFRPALVEDPSPKRVRVTGWPCRTA
ncbi:MAG: rod shape-determining protein MreD [Solirubrobacterales bacterium]